MLGIKFFPFEMTVQWQLWLFLSFQETEEDLKESEEYKEAQNIVDSIKPVMWFQTLWCSHLKIHLSVISFLLPDPVF